MAANVYEGMFIFDSGRYARDPSGISGGIEELIRSAGGEILASRLWEERRLAYPIKGQRRGTYWLTYFRVETNQLVHLNRQCMISENILRHLFLKVDPLLVETLVQHANSEGPLHVPSAQAATIGAIDIEDGGVDALGDLE